MFSYLVLVNSTFIFLTEAALAAGSEMEALQVRPNLYFGMRERKEPGVLLGMGWFKGSKIDELRYDCREPDHLARWGFLKADEDFGLQSFQDDWLTVTTEHALASSNSVVARINGTAVATTNTGMVSVLFTLHSPTGVTLGSALDPKGLRGDTVKASLLDRELTIHWGDLIMPHEDDVCTEHTERVRPGRPTPELLRTHVAGWRDTDLSVAFKVTDRIKSILKQSKNVAKDVARKLFRIYEPSEEAEIHKRVAPVLDNRLADSKSTTTVVFQRVLKVPFSIVVTLGPMVDDKNREAEKNQAEEEEQASAVLASKDNAFEARFHAAFPAIQNVPESLRKAAKAALGNTIGSIGWFYGSNLLEDHTWSQPPGPLLTGVPSRSFFPRGFFWDEGFHQLLVGRFNPGLAKAVIASWLSRFDSRGWVAREQVLGLEAIERVPREFLTQNRTYGNPPTLLLAVEALLLRKDYLEDDRAFYEKVLETFLKHREWLSRSQKSRFAEGLMAWKGRSLDAVHTLTSGIDDYPRGLPGDFYLEAHVDLLSWACWEDRMLASLTDKLGKSADTAAELRKSAEARWGLIKKYHWNPSLGFFNDLGFLRPKASVPELVPHIGYVGLMPFVLRLIPASKDSMDMLWDILKVLQDPKLLRAPGIGIRSLSKSDNLFGQGENYWRGAVWINLNYLCVEALTHYSRETRAIDGSFANLADNLAKELRKDLVTNIVNQYQAEGFLFESYDSVTGKGRGTRPFTGWTALVTLLMEDFTA